MNGLPLLPAITIDIIGSAANIVFSFLAWRYALLLAKRQPDNFVWGYLHYVTFAIGAFAILAVPQKGHSTAPLRFWASKPALPLNQASNSWFWSQRSW